MINNRLQQSALGHCHINGATVTKLLSHHHHQNADGFQRLSSCQDFAWSRSLWAKIAVEVTYVTTALLVVYVALASWGAYVDGLRDVDIP
jgi:hypothetical protein